MFNNRKFLAIIPARGGSKGIKNKNIRNLNGKPLIAYTIEEAKKCSIFDKIIVSTDFEKIAEISKKYGAEVPFIRPEYLATDNASSIDVIIHAINYFKEMGEKYDCFVLLQPTSPLRKAEDVLNALNLLFEKNADSVVSVCEVDHSPLHSNILPDNLSLENFIKEEVKNKRRQDLPAYYRINGAIYISKVDRFLLKKDFYSEKSYAYIMPKERSIDIDNIIDLQFAEFLMRRLKNEHTKDK